MFKFLRGITRSKVLKVGLAVLLTAVIAVSGVSVSDKLSPQSDSSLQVGVGQKVLTIGTIVYAAGTVDYTTDGVNDNVQFQAALDALPVNGGKISVLTGDYVFSATVTRAIANVTIEGNGPSTNFTYDGVNPIFTAGGNRWVFANFVTDAGGINMAATTGWLWSNVAISSTYYAARTPISSVTGVSWEIPTGRGATLFVASVNATPTEIAQADYRADGTADNVEIQAALNSSPGAEVKLSTGTFNIASVITVATNNTLTGSGRGTLLNKTGVAAYHIIDIPGAIGSPITGVRISNMSLDANYAFAADVNPIHGEYAVDTIVHDVWARESGDAAIEFDYSTGIIIDRTILRDNQGSGIHLSTNTTNSIINNSLVYNSNLIPVAQSAGFEIWGGAENITISNSGDFGSYRGFYLQGNSITLNGVFSFNPQLTAIETGTLAGVGGPYSINGMNIRVVGLTLTYLLNIEGPTTITGGVILGDSSQNGSRVYINGANSVISGVLIKDIGQDASSLVLNADNITAIGNILLDTFGIGIRINGSNARVIGNQIIDNIGGRTSVGIQDDGVNNSLILGNIIGTTTVQAIDAAAGSIVSKNGGWVTENSGTGTVTAGLWGVSVAHGLVTTPTRIHLTFSNNSTANIYYSAPGTTNFSANLTALQGTNVTFDWRAVIGEGN